MKRRDFIKTVAAGALVTGVTKDGWAVPGGEEYELERPDSPDNILSACPYCGVGCGTILKTRNGRIVNIIPDKDHPTNKGLQCIKGLTSAEAIYVNRLTAPLIRKDMSDPLRGKVSKTKGSYDPRLFRVATWDEAEELIADRIAEMVKTTGGNSVGLYGSGQLSLEGQYLENIFMKGVLGSNTIEANARMCMTSAVTGYIKSLGSDTPPTCYDDVELADMICFWGHNARGAHPILYWRVADTKAQRNIPTLVVDPRRTGTVQGLEEINSETSFHFPTINGDISIHNAIAWAILNRHPEVVAKEFMEDHTTGWQEYIDEVQKGYRPEDVVDRTKIAPEKIYALAKVWAEASLKGRQRGSGGVLCIWGIGYNQHLHGQHNTMSLVNLLALTGNIGRPGCGPHSQTGQPNAMGERLTGGLTGRLPFNIGLNNANHRIWCAEQWGVPAERLNKTAEMQNTGYAVGMMERALKGDVNAMFLIYATHIDLPDSYNLVRPALTRTFTVVQEIYKDAPNNLYADVILPAATWGEWAGGIYVQSERRLYVCDGTSNPVKGCRPDMDMVIDKGKLIAERLGLDVDKIFPYQRKENGMYDPEEVFRDFIRASKGTDSDLSGILEVEKETGKSPYEQIRELRGIQWPAPTAAIAKAGGTKRRYMGQEEYWPDKPYGEFRHPDGKLHIHMCHQDYSEYREVTDELSKAGTDPNFHMIDHYDLLVKARDMGLTPELPHADFLGRRIGECPKDRYPFWFATGVVYEHFHTAKTIRAGTTRKLVPEMYVEMHPEDAAELGVKDGQWVKITTRRGSVEARVSVGLDSIVKPARNTVPKGFLFSPWNLSVADSADPKKNRWLANGTTHRAFDPVSGQADFKKCAARVELI